MRISFIRTGLNITGYLLQYKWGASSIIALYLSLFSGVVVSLQYDPAAPYYSASSLDLLVPFGAFWRSLHFYSSQVFFLLSVSHLVSIILKLTHRRISTGRWVLLIASLAIILLMLFSGYVLRGDATGNSAGIIAENILLSTPVIGKGLNDIFFSIEETGMRRVYANHLIGLVLLWLALSWNHIRHYKVSWYRHGWLTIAIIAFCVLANAPMEPEKIGVFKIDGPWFFLGLQEMLRYMHPFLAGVLFPSSLVFALCCLNAGGKIEKGAKIFVSFWLVLYAGLTAAALL